MAYLDFFSVAPLISYDPQRANPAPRRTPLLAHIPRRKPSPKSRYNGEVLISFPKQFLLLALAACALLAPVRSAAAAPPGGALILVLPFDDNSRAPGLEWVGESFSEVLGMRLASPQLYFIGRADRNYALDRLGIPTTVHPSRATIYGIADEMDVDYVIMGSYTFDGQNFAAHGQLLDMKRLKMYPQFSESGPITQLTAIQGALAWRFLTVLAPDTAYTRDQFIAQTPPIPTDAFKNYIRGLLDTERPAKIIHFKEAVRLAPEYSSALLQLGKTYYQGRDYKSAIAWLEKVSVKDPAAPESRFYQGLAAYYAGEYDRAEKAFRFVAARFPLTEVYNNLGVLESRRGRRSAIDYFRKAVGADPQDPDYRFNLAIAWYRLGNREAAFKGVKEALALRSGDPEARELLALIMQPPAEVAPPDPASPVPQSIGASSPPSSPSIAAAPPRINIPAERIKSDYNETSYRELAMAIQNVREASLSHKDPGAHIRDHIARGRAWLQDGDADAAQREFHEALTMDPANAAARAGLARVQESKRDFAAAQAEAVASILAKPTAEAYLVLARLDMQNRNLQSALENADKALALEPASPEARDLKRKVATAMSLAGTHQF